jgi:MSHA biogenesis protein MshQ
VTFSKSVTGVSASNFSLVGGTGASVTTVTGSGTTWTVTASSRNDDRDAWTGDGQRDRNGRSGWGAAVGNVPFTTGQTYVDRAEGGLDHACGSESGRQDRQSITR